MLWPPAQLEATVATTLPARPPLRLRMLRTPARALVTRLGSGDPPGWTPWFPSPGLDPFAHLQDIPVGFEHLTEVRA